MVNENGKMILWDSLRRMWRDTIILPSVIAKTTQEIYKEKTGMNVQVQSVVIKWNICRIKIQNPLIASELSLISEDIKKASYEKLLKLGIHIPNNIILRFF